MTDSEKPGSDESRRMGAGAWVILSSLLFSVTAIVLFMMWFGNSMYFGEKVLMASAAFGFFGFVVGLAGLLMRVHLLIRIVMMVLATAALSIFVFALYRDYIAGIG